MTLPAYPAARVVAPKVHAHFAQHAEEAQRRGAIVAAVPDADVIEALIDAAFWASLRREETYVPKISLAFASPADSVHPLLFDRPLSLGPAALVKVAPAVERPGIHLGVSTDGSELRVWGTIRDIPALCVVVEVAAPGLLVVKHHRGDESGRKFANVAVLEGDQIKVVDEKASSLPDCPPLLTSLLGFESPAAWIAHRDSVNILIQLAVWGLKVFFFCWLQLMIRWTLPRFRPDQILQLGWLKMLPASILNVIITAGVLLFIR